MILNAKVIVSAVGVAALLTSPAIAKTGRHRHVATQVTVPANARADAGPQAGYNGQVQAVYAPDMPVPRHNNGLNPDFQLGAEK